MSGKDDSFVNDEPIATGPVRAQYHGDEALARSHLRDGRALLGRMKTNYGVNDRIARGEPGGHFRATKILGDGTRVEAFTNDGLDSVRITAPVQQQSRPEPVDTFSESTSYTPTPVDFEYEPDWPSKKEEEKAVRVAKYKPYLWIGVRIVKGDPPREWNPNHAPQKFAQRLHVCVWEPADSEDEEEVILSNRNDFELLYPPVLQYKEPESVYPLKHWEQHIPSDYVDPRADAGNFDGYPPEGLPTQIAYTDKKLVMIQPNNLYDIPMRVPDYDPRHDEDIEWDIMFISDPDNDLQLVDTVDEELKMEGSQSGGNYKVKICSVGGDCLQLNPVEVEIKIYIGKDDERHVGTHRFWIKEHTEYRMGIMPKGWFKEFEPWPDHPCDSCSYRAPDHGPNPHGNHWWQGMAVAGVPHFQEDTPEQDWLPPVIHFSKEDKVELPSTGFEPSTFFSRPDLCPGCAVTSTRYHQTWLVTPHLWWEYEPVTVCAGNTDTVLGPFIDEPHFAWTYKALSSLYGVLPDHAFARHNVQSVSFQSPDTGETLTLSVLVEPTLSTHPPEIVQTRWLAYTGIGGRCIGTSHDASYTSDTRTDILKWVTGGDNWSGFQAHFDNILGGPTSNTLFRLSWVITTTSDWNSSETSESLQFISNTAFEAGPFKVHNNPDARGEDVCARIEVWDWDDSEHANLPPNHQR